MTEKFYDPLIVGSVPIYWGAPNINDFSPGDHSFVDVQSFDSPRDLAFFLKQCCEDGALYEKLFTWKESNLNKKMEQKIMNAKPNVYISAFTQIKDKVKNSGRLTLS